MNNTANVALYARVSSQRQADEGTIESQRQAIIDRITQDGFQMHSDLEFCDEGYSGAQLLRPELERLRDRISTSTIDRLYIHSPDRLSRKMAHQAILLEEFAKYDCHVIFLNQQDNSDSPEANLLLQMQGMIAEYEREKILERTRRGRKHSARQGNVSVFGKAPYGYRYISKSLGEGTARWEIDPVRSDHVRLMFQWVGVEQCSLSEVARRLSDRSIKTAKGHDRWDRATIRGILRNPAYHGHARYGKERLVPRKTVKRAKHGDPAIPRQAKVAKATDPAEQIVISVPSIVDIELFDQVGKRMDENRRRQRERQNGGRYLLSGLAICGECGRAFCSRRFGGGKYFYYRCIGADRHRRKNTDQSLCDNPSVKGNEIEQMVWEDVCHLLTEPDRLLRELESRQTDRQQPSESLVELEKTVSQLRSRLDRLIDGYESGLIAKSEFETRIVPLRERYDRESSALESLSGSSESEADVESINELLKSLGEEVATQLSCADWELKRDLVKLLIDRVEVFHDEVRLVYKVPPNPFDQSLATRGFLQHWLQRQHVAPGVSRLAPKAIRCRHFKTRASGQEKKSLTSEPLTGKPI